MRTAKENRSLCFLYWVEHGATISYFPPTPPFNGLLYCHLLHQSTHTTTRRLLVIYFFLYKSTHTRAKTALRSRFYRPPLHLKTPNNDDSIEIYIFIYLYFCLIRLPPRPASHLICRCHPTFTKTPSPPSLPAQYPNRITSNSQPLLVTANMRFLSHVFLKRIITSPYPPPPSHTRTSPAPSGLWPPPP